LPARRGPQILSSTPFPVFRVFRTSANTAIGRGAARRELGHQTQAGPGLLVGRGPEIDNDLWHGPRPLFSVRRCGLPRQATSLRCDVNRHRFGVGGNRMRPGTYGCTGPPGFVRLTVRPQVLPPAGNWGWKRRRSPGIPHVGLLGSSGRGRIRKSWIGQSRSPHYIRKDIVGISEDHSRGFMCDLHSGGTATSHAVGPSGEHMKQQVSERAFLSAEGVAALLRPSYGLLGAPTACRIAHWERPLILQAFLFPSLVAAE
jgi:hypothetical protein